MTNSTSSIAKESILDDYLISDPDAEPFFHKLNQHFNTDGTKYDFSQVEIERAIIINEITLKQFEDRSKCNQELMIDFACKLYSRKEAFKGDPEKTKQLNRLTDAYAANHGLHKRIQQGLVMISIFLTPARQAHPISIDQLHSVEKICLYALDFFPHLSFKLQQDLKRVQGIFNIEQPEQISQNPHYNSLKALFAKMPAPIPSAESSASSSSLPSIEQITNEVPFFVVEESDSENSDDEVAAPTKKKKGFFSRVKNLIKIGKKEKAKEDSPLVFYKLKTRRANPKDPAPEPPLEVQLKKLYQFFQRVSTHYFTDILFKPNTPLAQFFNQRFTELLPHIGRPLLVQEPRIIARMEKQMCIDSLMAIELFFLDFTKSCDTLNPSATMYHTIKLRTQLKADQVFGPNELQLKLVEQMNTIVEILIFNKIDPNQTLTKTQEFFQLVISTFSIELINLCFEPDAIAFIIHRILEGTVWKTSESAHAHHPLCSEFDDVFSKELGTCIENLADKFFLFGEADGFANFIRKIVLLLIQNQKEKIGAYIQSRLNGITASECSVEPIKFLDLILFSGEDKRPTLFDFLNKSKEEKQQFRVKLRKSIEEELIPQWIEKLKAENKTVSFVHKFESSKSFCNTITQRIYMLLDNKDLLRTLVYHLLEGVKHSLKVEYKRATEDRHSKAPSLSPPTYIHAQP